MFTFVQHIFFKKTLNCLQFWRIVTQRQHTNTTGANKLPEHKHLYSALFFYKYYIVYKNNLDLFYNFYIKKLVFLQNGCVSSIYPNIINYCRLTKHFFLKNLKYKLWAFYWKNIYQSYHKLQIFFKKNSQIFIIYYINSEKVFYSCSTGTLQVFFKIKQKHLKKNIHMWKFIGIFLERLLSYTKNTFFILECFMYHKLFLNFLEFLLKNIKSKIKKTKIWTIAEKLFLDIKYKNRSDARIGKKVRRLKKRIRKKILVKQDDVFYIS